MNLERLNSLLDKIVTGKCIKKIFRIWGKSLKNWTVLLWKIFAENLLEVQIELKKSKQAWSTEFSTYVYNCT